MLVCQSFSLNDSQLLQAVVQWCKSFGTEEGGAGHLSLGTVFLWMLMVVWGEEHQAGVSSFLY